VSYSLQLRVINGSHRPGTASRRKQFHDQIDACSAVERQLEKEFPMFALQANVHAWLFGGVRLRSSNAERIKIDFAELSQDDSVLKFPDQGVASPRERLRRQNV
jgi:hypothetical protein